jgi:hypothetical protein
MMFMMNLRRALVGLALAVFVLFLSGCSRLFRVPALEDVGPEDIFHYYEDRARELECLVADLKMEIAGADISGLICLKRDDEFEVLIQGYAPAGLPGFELVSLGSRFQLLVPSERAFYANEPDLLGGLPDQVSSLSAFAEKFFPPCLLLDQLPVLMGELRRKGREYVWKVDGEGYRLIELEGAQMVRGLWFDPESLALTRVEVYVEGELFGEVILRGGRFLSVSRFGWIPRRLEINYQGEQHMIFLDHLRINPEPAPEISFRPVSGFTTILITGE